MQSLPHIEKSAFRRGEYVTYVNGAQRIRRTASGWETYALGSQSGQFVRMSGPTLSSIDAQCAKLTMPAR